MAINYNIDLDDLIPIKCKKCSHITFKQVVILNKLSALISPTGKDEIIPIEIFVCEKCGEINTDGLNKDVVEMLKRNSLIKPNLEIEI
jgi:uncharacterized Zn finger protein